MKRTFLFFLVAAGLLTASCRKSPDYDQLSSNFVVITNADTTTAFNSFKTYYISDTITYLSSSSTDTILFDENAKKLVQTVKDNMNARGYSFVAKNNHPDIGFNLGVVKTLNVGVSYPGWWWGYPGWWDPWYWGWYYPYYYPWSITYVVTTGTVILDMVDLKDANSKQQLRVLWNGYMGGAVGSDIGSNVQRGVDAINTSFTQSPYINAN